jgi:hypothetical protein
MPKNKIQINFPQSVSLKCTAVISFEEGIEKKRNAADQNLKSAADESTTYQASKSNDITPLAGQKKTFFRKTPEEAMDSLLDLAQKHLNATGMGGMIELDADFLWNMLGSENSSVDINIYHPSLKFYHQHNTDNREPIKIEHNDGTTIRISKNLNLPISTICTLNLNTFLEQHNILSRHSCYQDERDDGDPSQDKKLISHIGFNLFKHMNRSDCIVKDIIPERQRDGFNKQAENMNKERSKKKSPRAKNLEQDDEYSDRVNYSNINVDKQYIRQFNEFSVQLLELLLSHVEEVKIQTKDNSRNIKIRYLINSRFIPDGLKKENVKNVEVGFVLLLDLEGKTRDKKIEFKYFMI